MAILTVTNNADNGAGSLRQAIANANAGDTIQFQSSLANQTITLTSGQIEIAVGKDLTIDGGNAANLTISGNNASRIFHVDSASVNPTNIVLKNLTLANGRSNEYGGAIKTEHQATLDVQNVQFKNNVADEGGGAIFSAFEGALTVTNSQFDRNIAIAGNSERGAGAIAFWGPGNCTIRNSDFTNNRGIVGGAINSLNGKLTVENSRFINNDTLAATFDTGQPNDFLRGYGGAIYTDRASSLNEASGTIRISDTLFEGNRAKAGGGATHLFTGTQDNIIIENSTYRNNSVVALPGGEGGDGGGLYAISNGLNRGLVIRNTSFVSNTSTGQGGGVRTNDMPTTITNSTFSGNQAIGSQYSSGGGIVLYNGASTITNTTFANNVAGWAGGGIASASGTAVTLKNSLFSNNTANNPYNIQLQGSGNFTDGGNNLQYPPKATNFGNDQNVLPNILIADPKLGALQSINGRLVHPLLPGSAAIDAGTNVGIPNTDQTGGIRPQDGDLNGSAIADIGAYESPGTTPLIPEIQVLNGAVDIVDGTTTALDFGTTTVGTAITKTFTLKNLGTGTLNLSNLQLPTGFSLVGNFPATLAAGGSTALQIQLNATTAGTPTGQLSITNNDSDENPFNFNIRGTVTTALVPEIQVLNGAVDIVDGTTTALDFGTTTVGTAITKTFTLKNLGTGTLNLSNLQLPTGFSLVGNFPATLAAGGSTPLQIQLNATTAGTPTGQLSLTNNDSDENPFNFNIRGTVTTALVPEITVKNGTTNIVDGTTTAINVGTANVGGTLTKTFTIVNDGTGTLNLNAPNLPNGFSLVGTLPTSLAAGGSTNLTVALNTATAGTYTGTISFGNNDSDESPFDFVISGTVAANSNHAPTVVNPVVNQVATASQPFSLTIGTNTFNDADGDALTYTAKLANGDPLPSWLTFNATTRTFSGTPGTTNLGTLSISLTANDGKGGSVVDVFDLAVRDRFNTINGTNLSETLNGTAQDDQIYGFDGQDLIMGGLGNDQLRGGKGQDRLWGQDGNDSLWGDAGQDRVYGGLGNDLVYGNDGDDLLYGDEGSDRLFGGAGNDIVTGGTGADTIALQTNQGIDTITDFKVGEDRIGLVGSLSFGQLSITQQGSQTWITTAQNQLLAKLDGVNAASLTANSFVHL